MRIQKKYISIVVLVAFLLTIVNVPVLAEEVQDGLETVTNEMQQLFVADDKATESVQALAEGETSGVCGENATWTFADGVLTISGTGEITNPSWLQMQENITSVVMDDSITDLGHGAFEGCVNLKNVKLSNQLTTLGLSTFHECSSLETIALPESISEIGTVVFRNCTSLTSIVIPENVAVINEQTFYGCTALTSVILPEGLTSIGTNVFGECKQLSEINIPSTVTSIGANAFYNCSALQQVTLPNNLETLGRAAFGNCKVLENITIPQGVTEIAESAFYGCSNLSNVILPNNITKIGYNAFGECTSFTSITIPESVTQIDKLAFGGCTDIKEIYFLGDMLECSSDINVNFLDGTLEVTAYYPINNPTWDLEKMGQMTIQYGGYGAFYIDWQPFDGLNKVCGVELDRTDTTIVVNDTLQLTETILPTTAENKAVTWTSSNSAVATVDKRGLVTAVATGSADITVTTTEGGYTASCRVSVIEDAEVLSGYYGKNLYDVYWTLNLKTGLMTFKGTGAIADWYPDSSYVSPWPQDKIKKVVIEEGITAVGAFNFYDSVNLTEVTFPDSLQEIGSSAFTNCISLEKLIIPDSVTQVGDSAFLQCLGLKYVDVGDGISSFSGFDFHDRRDNSFPGIGLEEIVIGTNISEIPESMFSDCTELKAIEIHQNITKIGDFAFSGCIMLDKITVPDTVTELGIGAFENCTGLTEAVIGVGVQTLKVRTFNGCEKLNKVILSDNLVSIEGAPYDGPWTVAGVFENCTSLQNFDFPKQLQQIGNAAFAGCSSLKQINIPDTVTTLGERSFQQCTGLTDISVGNGITEIKAGTFADCVNLQNITLGSTIRVIDGNSILKGAFENCTSLKQILLPASLETIGDYAFKNCSALLEMILPNYVSTVGAGAFDGCTALEKVVLSDSLQEIGGNNAFSGVGDALRYLDTGDSIDVIPHFKTFLELETMIFGDNITSIPTEEFANCKQLKNVIFGSGLKSIGNSAFYGCTSLPEIIIPDNVVNIGTAAFGACDAVNYVNTGNGVNNVTGLYFNDYENLQRVVIGNSIDTIPANCFKDCAALIDITLGNSVATIGASAFENCSILPKIILPTGVQEITDNTFANCTALTTVDLPKGLNTIGTAAFSNCGKLDNITIPTSVTTIDKNAFKNCASLSEIIIPDGVTRIAESAFAGASALSKVTIGTSVSSIDNQAFIDCTTLKTVVVPDNVKAINNQSFANCKSLENMIVPASVTGISTNAFDSCDNLTLYGYAGSYVESYATSKSIPFFALYDGDVPSPNGTVISLIAQTYNIGVGAGNAINLRYIIKPDSAKEMNVTWTITDPSIVKLTSAEIGGWWLEGLKPGTTTIKATTEDGASSTRTITVDNTGDLDITNIHISGDLVCELDKTLDVTATAVYPSNFLERGIEWSVADSSVIEIVEVISNGENGVGVVRVKGLKLGETTITATTKDGASFTQTITVKEIKEDGSEDINPNGFSAQKDGWAFCNSVYGFNYPSDYEIPQVRYLDVFGLSGALMKTSKWGGNCFGMSSTAAKFYLDELNWQHYQDEYSSWNFDTVNSFYLDKKQSIIYGTYMCAQMENTISDITQLVENYQVWTNSMDFDQIISNADIEFKNSYCGEPQKWQITVPQEMTVYSYPHNIDGRYIANLMRKLESSTKPYIIGLAGTVNHAVIFRTDKPIEQLVDNPATVEDESKWYRVYIYDPNNPYFNTERYNVGLLGLAGWHLNYYLDAKEDRYIDLNPSENKFRGTFGSNGSADIKYLGCDLDGNPIMGRIVESDSLAKVLPDMIYLVDPSDVPSDFSNVNCLPRVGSLRIDVDPDIIYDLFDDAGSLVGHAEDGVFVTAQDNMHYIPNIGQSVDSDERSGHVVIKDENIILQSQSNLDVELMSSNAINRVITNQPVKCFYDGIKNKLTLKTDRETMVAVSIANVVSRDVYTEIIYNATIPAEKQLSIILDKDNQMSIEADYEGLLDSVVIKTEKGEEKNLENVEIKDLSKQDVNKILQDGVVPLLSINMDADNCSLTIGSEKTLVTKFSPTNATNKELTWASSNPSVATVDNDGKVTAIAAGEAIITATAKNTDKTAKCVVTVQNNATEDGDNTVPSKPSSGGSSGGFSGVYNYPVKADDVDGATVYLDKSNAVAGDKVVITVTPDNGKQVDEVIVTDADNEIITVTRVGDNKYNFIMPEGAVKVSVTTVKADYDTRVVLQIGNKNVVINDRNFSNDVAPVIVVDRTMVPIRVVTETLGGKADWNEATRTVTLAIDGKVLRMTIDKTIPGFDAVPMIINSRTYVPIRYVAEALGAKVEWIAETKQIIIEK